MALSYLGALAQLAGHTDLEKVASGHYDPPTLDRARALAAALADPQGAYEVVHLTGTNGKGSTARMTTALLAATGLSVGTYTSPHLERVNERLARNGEPIDDPAFAAAVEAAVAAERIVDVRATFFELLTVAAYAWFADVAVDVAVVEVGLGGTWDATNIVTASVSVVTNIGLDHTALLGPTTRDIAGEKAGIVEAGRPLVLGEVDPSLLPVFEARDPDPLLLRGRDFACTANVLGVGGRLLDLRTPGAAYEEVFLPLHGAHQGDNAAAALAAAEAFFGRPLGEDVVQEAFSGVRVPGRFEVVGRAPLVVLDGAHNPDGARAAAATAADFAPGGERVLVVGINRDRDPVEMLEALDARAAKLVITCAADWPRAMPAGELAEAARSLGLEVEAVATVGDAVARAVALAGPEDLVLVAGSLYVVGAARAGRSPVRQDDDVEGR